MALVHEKTDTSSCKMVLSPSNMVQHHSIFYKIQEIWPQVESKLAPGWTERAQVGTKVAEVGSNMAVVGTKMASMQARWVQIQPQVVTSWVEDGQNWVRELLN